MQLKVRDIVSEFFRKWKSLFAADLIFQLVSLVVLTPIVAFVFRSFVWMSGENVLTDLQFASFFTSVTGLLCFVVVLALGATIEAFGLVSLLFVIAAIDKEERIVLRSLRQTTAKMISIFRLAIRMTAELLLFVLPFLFVAGGSYFYFLSEHDINYYLHERPREFWIAVFPLSLCILGLIAVLFVFLVRWFSAIPLVVFENKSVQDAISTSKSYRKRIAGVVLLWFLKWLISIILVSWILNACVIVIAKFWIPKVSTSLLILEVSLCLFLLFQFLVNVFLNLLGSATFAIVYFKLFESLTGTEIRTEKAIVESETSNRLVETNITKPRLILWATLGITIAVSINFLTISSLPMEDDVIIIAHRGSSKLAPENTIAAIEQAIVDGADFVEIDVQETEDGEVVVYHDKDFMRLATKDLKIWDATLEDLEEIDIGSSFNSKFSLERVPTLRDVLERCKDRIQLVVELKTYGRGVMLEKRVAELVENAEMVDQSEFMSLSQEQIQRFKQIRPDWKTGLLMSVSSGKINRLDVDFLAVNSKFATHEFISQSHRNGKGVYAWTVNDAETMSILIDRGIDGLITDRPSVARKLLDQRKSLSQAERLLLRFAHQWGLAPNMDSVSMN